MKAEIQRLQMLVENNDCNWWKEVDNHELCDNIWKDAYTEWYREDYLKAMKGFQHALTPYVNAWKGSFSNNFYDAELICDIEEKAQELAKRLLFCAYCELDGNQLEIARDHLVLCLSILINSPQFTDGTLRTKEMGSLFDDAFMELMLSMEEIPECRKLARQVAHMAILSGNCCGWKHPLQRPGYMVSELEAIPYVPSNEHPPWCQTLADNWEGILNDYMSVAQSDSLSTVGAGVRGSGHDDHRVIAPGHDWTEYVLFGTGSRNGDCPLTKELLQHHVPDAISLTERGGGEIIFSRLAPGTHIQAHCGPTNFRWTAHLGLIIPKNSCRIRVEHDWHSWHTGQVLLFDDSFEHEVRNDSNEERVVLLLRIWHPGLSEEKRTHVLQEAIQKKQNAIEKRYHPPP